MKIIGHTIHFNSIPEFYNKEILKFGNVKKSNTVRKMDWFEYDNLPTNLEYIAIHNCIFGKYFIRKLTDISFYDNRVIFSW